MYTTNQVDEPNHRPERKHICIGASQFGKQNA